VGFHVEQAADAARPLDDGGPRPMQASAWYPAAPAPDVPALHYRDFVALEATELAVSSTGDGGPAGSAAEPGGDAVAAYRALLVDRAGLPAEAADRLLAAASSTRRDVPAAGGSYPVVLLAQGNGNSPHRQSVLSAFLASHGFVVLTMPSASRITGFPTAEAEVLPKAEEQATDLAWLAHHAGELSPAAVRRGRGGNGLVHAVVGYSFGARAALVYQLRGGGAAALASIDGGIGNAAGKDFLAADPSLRPGDLSVPVLHVYQPGDDYVEPDFDLLNRMRGADRWLVQVTGLRHGHFSNSGMLRSLGAGYEALVPAGYDPQPAVEATWSWLRAFLDATLVGERGGFDALVAAGPGGPVVAVETLPARAAGTP
jgi:dienelactone hydrolase